MTQTNLVPDIGPPLPLTEKAPAPPVLADSGKRPLTALASPVSGIMTNERQIDWFLTIGEQWTSLPEEIKDAMILLQRAFPASGGGTYYLTPPQALMVVRYCREKGIGVHSDTWWFDPRNYRVGSTVSGLREEARARKLDLGPPVLTRINRPWPVGKLRFKGRDPLEQDFGFRCEITVGDKKQPASCEVWFSTSAQTSDKARTELRPGPWSDNPDHMLQVRAIGTTTKFAMGSGISQMPEDVDEAASK